MRTRLRSITLQGAIENSNSAVNIRKTVFFWHFECTNNIFGDCKCCETYSVFCILTTSENFLPIFPPQCQSIFKIQKITRTNIFKQNVAIHKLNSFIKLT